MTTNIGAGGGAGNGNGGAHARRSPLVPFALLIFFPRGSC